MKKKKVWYLDVVSEEDSELFWCLLECGYCGDYSTRKEGVEALKLLAREAKTTYKKELDADKLAENTLSIVLYVGKVNEDFNEEIDNFFEASTDNYHAVVERLLCGCW